MDCPNCEGNGELERPAFVAEKEDREGTHKEAPGRMVNVVCPRCNGSGYLEV